MRWSGYERDGERSAWFVRALRLSPSGFFEPLFPKTCPSRQFRKDCTLHWDRC